MIHKHMLNNSIDDENTQPNIYIQYYSSLGKVFCGTIIPCRTTLRIPGIKCAEEMLLARY